METLASGYGLIEGPVWDARRGLLFSDVPNGGVYCLDREARVSTVVPHRRGIGGLALHAEGGLVVGGRNIAYKGPQGEDTVVLLGQDCVPDIVGFNDLTTDAAGRIYAGSLGSSPSEPDAQRRPGHLHLIDLDGSSRVLASDIVLSNGLGFSPDGRRLYHSDSRAGLIGVYSVDDHGRSVSVGPRTTFSRVESGIPDGLCVAEDGSIWVAIAHGGVVIGYEPDGSVRRRIDIGHPMPTSVCFGGEGLGELYVVTGSGGTGREDGGVVLRTRVGVAGLPAAPARVSM